MKNERELNRELIHKALDGDAGPDEEQVLMDRIQSDPELKEEFEEMASMLRSVETMERLPVPPFYTAEVMRRLPRKKAALGRRVWDFFFMGRMLKWNVATVLAGVLLFLVLTQATRLRDKPLQTSAADKQGQYVKVTMNYYAPDAHHVAVAGTFNKWDADADVLRKGENGVWTINMTLKPGAYAYTFIVDGKTWVADPDAQAYVDDGFGGRNSLVRVKI